MRVRRRTPPAGGGGPIRPRGGGANEVNLPAFRPGGTVVTAPVPLRIRGPEIDGGAELLSATTMEFVGALVDRFAARRAELLARRPEFHERLRAGGRPDFPAESRSIRDAEWRVAPPPAELLDRRVEITAPPERRMILHALNSGARVYMADFEDAHAPTWAATLRGQANLVDAVRERIEHRGRDGTTLTLHHPHAVLFVRPRGWHLEERHIERDGRPIPASLCDFGIYFAANARELVRRGHGVYLYLPKLEHAAEAELWAEIFRWSEDRTGLPRGTIRATALIETLPAVFEAEEILYALRAHSAGLNSGRWDYIFSFLKEFRDDPTAIFPDRAGLTMDRPFLAAYDRHLVRTAHRRGAHAIGGMAPQIPIPGDPAENERAMALVRADKEREVALGHDGTWVAHPGLVPLATEIFDRGMPTPHQIDRAPALAPVRAEELLAIPAGSVTEAGIRTNAHVALGYLESWLRGVGCVPIDHRMEDAATVEISRAQLWQWVHRGAALASGGRVDLARVRAALGDEAERLAAERRAQGGDRSTIEPARRLLEEMVADPACREYFTPRAYEMLAARDGAGAEDEGS